jgi:hypothetical protein
VDGEAFAGASEVGGRPERVGEDGDARLRPPERGFLPARNPRDAKERERSARDSVEGNDVKRDGQALGKRGAITLVPVEKLDHPGRLPRSAHAFLEGVVREGIDQPAGTVDDECVRNPFEEALLAPPEAMLELVAGAKIGHVAGKPYRN